MVSNPEKPTSGPTIVLPDDAPHLLVVDDDSRIRSLLSKYLSENGYRVTVADSAASARRKLASLAFDLLVIDVMMPGESGTELTRSLRRHLDVPVLILTALGGADNRIEGLEVGADDYLSKPFEPRELLLRIASILKRTGQPAIGMPTEIRFGPYTFHMDKMELRKAKKAIRLTERERQLLKLFADNPGDTIARHRLIGDDASLGERTADVQINRLRRKIETDPANPTYIQTVRGVGYRLITD